MRFFTPIIFALFFFINYLIIRSDILHKKIPNRYLGYLLLLLPFYFFAFIQSGQMSFGSASIFLLQLLLAILVSFLLYYAGIWSAGDAKYLLVLSLFLLQTGIIPFVGNIALVTLAYLFIYFLYFYLGKCLFDWGYAHSLYDQMVHDLKDRFLTFIKHSDGIIYKNQAVKKILRWCIMFGILFVALRLSRMYLLDFIKTEESFIFTKNFLQKYSTYIITGTVAVLFGLFYIIRYIVSILKVCIYKKLAGKSKDVIDFTLLGILFILLASFVGYEYLKNPSEILGYFRTIVTFSLKMYIIFKILYYAHRVTFQLAEQDFIGIERLAVGDIVDKTYLIKAFGTQVALGYGEKKGLLSPNPSEYFENMENPIDQETFDMIEKVYKKVNAYHKKNKTPGFHEINTIKILKTFPFGVYIFLGFVVSFSLGGYPLYLIIQSISSMFHIKLFQ